MQLACGLNVKQMRALVDAYVPEKKYRFDDAVVEKAAHQGRPTKEEKVGNVPEKGAIGPLKRSGSGPNTRERLLARLKRDHPKIAEKYAEGKFPSVRAAAIEAKLVKQTITVPVDMSELQYDAGNRPGCARIGIVRRFARSPGCFPASWPGRH